MHGAQLTLDGFSYDIRQVDAPQRGQNGLPDQTKPPIHLYVLVVDDPGIHVEIVFNGDDWKLFQQRIAKGATSGDLLVPRPPSLIVPNGHRT